MADRVLSAALLSLAGLAGLAFAGGALLPEVQSEDSCEHTLVLAPAPKLLPPPTEHWAGEGAESRNKKARKAWMNDWAHRAPPDVDYKEIERANGLAQVAKRNALAGMVRPPDLPEGVWEERGSDNQAGRMHVAQYSPDGTTLYAGSSKGGVWKGSLDGTEWTPIGDNLYGGAHWLTVASVGEVTRVLAATDGNLVHFSDDDGQSWTPPSGLIYTHSVRRIAQSTVDPQVVFLISKDWVYTDQWTTPSSLYRSEDGGKSFAVVRELGGLGADVFLARDGSDDTLYLVDDGGLWISEDLGETWEDRGDLPLVRSARITGSEAGAPRLYVVTESPDVLFRTDDLGASWTEVTAVSDYWGTLSASIVDPDVFAWGGVEVHRTFNGQDFEVVNRWGEYYYGGERDKLHADTPGMDVLPDGEGGEVWYISTDGGLYHSQDSLRSVENLSLDGLRVSQYYDTLTSAANPEHVHAGAQDQGYQVTQGVGQDEDGVYGFYQSISGDYAHLTSGDGTHATVFSVYPGFMLVAYGEDSSDLGYLDFPRPAKSMAWLPPLTADPLNPTSVLFCAEQLYRYDYSQEAGTWVSSLHSEFNFAAASDEYLSAVTFAPSDPNRAVAATNYGRIFMSEDGAVTWSLSEGQGPYPHYFYGHSLVVSQADPDVVYIGGSGYGGDTVYRSTDGGENWSPWSEGMPSTTAFTMAEARDGSGRLFAATETAAYVRHPTDGEWEDLTGADAPVTTYWSVEILPHENTARFGTYGRGIWDFRMETPQACYPVVDADGDGVSCLEDCNDENPAMGLPEEEICGDGIDQDCDGEDLACEEDTDDTEEPQVEPPNPIEPQGCGGCGGGLGGASWIGGLALLFLTRRRRAI